MAQVTVGITTYNRSEFLKATLECFLAQTKVPDEIIVYDNCSTDNTAQMVKEMQEYAPFIQYVRSVHHEQKYLTNVPRLIRKAHYPYFLYAQDDDWWHPEFLEKLTRTLDRNPDYGAIMCWFRDHRTFPFSPNEPGTVWKHHYTNLPHRKVYAHMMRMKNNEIFSMGMYRTKLLQKLVERGYPNVYQDVWVWLGEVALATRLYSYPEVLFSKYRQPLRKQERHDYMQEFLDNKRPHTRIAWAALWWPITSPNIPLYRKITMLPEWVKFAWRIKYKIRAEFAK